jgi:hypothetical protein
LRTPFKHNITEEEKLRLVRARNEKAVGWLFQQVETYLKQYLRNRNPDYKWVANLIASETVTIILEKEQDPILTSALVTYAIGIAKNQCSRKKPTGRWDTPRGKFIR